VTTLLVIHAPQFKRIRCDAHCHNSKTKHCDCVCDGLYHGLGEGSQALRAAVREWQPKLLALYCEAARQWHCVVEFAREDLDSPPTIRDAGRIVRLQTPLPL
jgi:hypothetical protein